MRNLESVTYEENQTFLQFARQNGINTDGEVGDHNSRLFLQYLNGPITWANLDLVFNQIRPQVGLRNPVEAEWVRLKTQLSEQDINVILQFIPYYSLSDEGDDFIINASTIASYMIRNSQPVTIQNLTSKIGAIGNVPGSTLRWRRKLQDSERRAQQEKEQAQKDHEIYLQNNPQGKTNPTTTDPKLAEHKRILERPPQPGDVGYEAPAQDTNSSDNFYKNRAESLVGSIQSNLDREEAAQFLTKAGAWGWQIVCGTILNYIERRKVERERSRYLSYGGGQ